VTAAGASTVQANPALATRVGRAPGRVVVGLTGELDASTAPALRRLLDDLVEGQGNLNVAVDLSGLAWVDADGLGALVASAQRLRARGRRLTLTGVRPRTYGALEAAGLTRAFAIEASPQVEVA